MTTTPTPVERAAAAIHADCGPDITSEYDDLEPETQAQWRGYAQHALAAALDADEIARAIHDVECGCAYDGEHTYADIDRRQELAAALVAHLTGATR